jgi:hypothetical protein
MIRQNFSTACLGCMTALLVSCSQATPYQPESASSAVRGGYSHQQIAADQFRVRFHGNAQTSRETVEAYLLYHAAEVTLEQGGDWFRISDRTTEHTITREQRIDPLYRPWYGPGYRYWLPYWSYRLQGGGWILWDPWRAEPFWADRLDWREVEEFEATADISIGRGPLPGGDPRAYGARQVMADIGPQVVRPGER